jgi:hypothetical protein
MTDLRKFQEAYASMEVAAYEPLILRWVSGWTLLKVADQLVWREAKTNSRQSELPTAISLNLSFAGVKAPALGELRNLRTRRDATPSGGFDVSGHAIDDQQIRAVEVDGWPNAVMVGNRLYPNGILTVRSDARSAPPARPGLFGIGRTTAPVRAADRALGVRTLPILRGDFVAAAETAVDQQAMRQTIFSKLADAARTAQRDTRSQPGALAMALSTATQNVDGKSRFHLWPTKNIEEALSPIGVAHYYRQLYFNLTEGVGPIEEAFTIAPLETLEVVYQVVRRLVHEEEMQTGLEIVSEKAQEAKDEDEISDKVSSMVQQDMSVSMSADAGGSIGVWEVGASSGGDLNSSAQQAREIATRRLRDMTTRASERITKSFSIKTHDLDESTTTNLTRRLIRNEGDHPVSYGLRRVLRRVRVKVQDLGPSLVWQTYVAQPGDFLARSRFVQFPKEVPIAAPDLPPGVPPRPVGGVETGTATVPLVLEGLRGEIQHFDLTIKPGADRVPTAITIDSIAPADPQPGDPPIIPVHTVQTIGDAQEEETTNVYLIRVDIEPVAGMSNLIVNYSYVWEPAQQVLDAWEAQRSDAQSKVVEDLLKAQFERHKELITERSKIRPRPANDLRREERYQVMSRVVASLLPNANGAVSPTPLEIEFFNRYFDLEGMFIYTHPAWWKARYAPHGTRGHGYEITADSEPAPMGSSLRWAIQLDGDSRRNEFLNSPWVRVCLPIRAKREREAIAWLAAHVEGDIGYDPTKDPLKTLLNDIDKVREDQSALGMDGPEYVVANSDSSSTSSSTVKADQVYPIIHEFDVTVPTDGFVYDELTLV